LNPDVSKILMRYRYCISLTDDRPIQMAEENFFRYFADKNVPLVFVFTKYDRLVTTFVAEIFQTTGRMTATEWREAEQKAQEYTANIRDKLERAVGKGVTVQAVDDKS
jgi:GTP-binding protein EngB required for normal cell division